MLGEDGPDQVALGDLRLPPASQAATSSASQCSMLRLRVRSSSRGVDVLRRRPFRIDCTACRAMSTPAHIRGTQARVREGIHCRLAVETNPKQCTLASGRMSDGSTPRFLQGPFDFEGNGLDKPLLLDDSLRYVVPAGCRNPAGVLPRRQLQRRLVTVVLFRDGKPMRYFPIAARGATHVALRVVEDLSADTRARTVRRRARGLHGNRGRRPRTGGDLMMAPKAGGRRQRHGRGAGDRGDPRPRRRRDVRHHGVRRRAVRQLQPDPAVATCWPAATMRARSTSTRWTGTPTTASTCAPACGWSASTATRSWCTPTTARSARYDNLILATGSRSFFPPMAGLVGRQQDADRRRLRVPHASTTAWAMIDPGRAPHKAVVIGGGLLGLEAARGLQNRGLHVDVVHAGQTLMNAQLDDMGGRDPAPVGGGAGNSRCTRRSAPPRSAPTRTADWRESCSPTAVPSTATCW